MYTVEQLNTHTPVQHIWFENVTAKIIHLKSGFIAFVCAMDILLLPLPALRNGLTFPFSVQNGNVRYNSPEFKTKIAAAKYFIFNFVMCIV